MLKLIFFNFSFQLSHSYTQNDFHEQQTRKTQPVMVISKSATHLEEDYDEDLGMEILIVKI